MSMSCSGKTLSYILIVAFLGVLVYSLFLYNQSNNVPQVPLNQVVDEVKNGQVQKVTIDGQNLTINLKDGKTQKSVIESQTSFTQILTDSKIDLASVEIDVKNTSANSNWIAIISGILPVILIAGFIYLMLRSAQAGNTRALSFGQSRARLLGAGQTKVKFSDVAGLEEPKQELLEVVEFLKNPQKFRRLGAEIPKGVLLIGPPGTGKCLTGETKILTNKGLISIKDIPKYFYVDNKHRVYGAKIVSLDIDKKKNILTPASHWYNLGEQKTIKIKTRMGHSIEGTPEHPIVILDKDGNFTFKRLDQIEEGDYTLIRYATETYGNLRQIPNKDTAYLLGFLSGDGNLTIKNRITYSTANPKISAFIKNYLKKNFNYSPIKSRDREYDWIISRRDIVKKIFAYGLLPVYSKDKEIPDSVLLAPKEIVVSFLQGLFDSDGSVDKRGVIEFSSSSRKLVDSVNLLLLNLGIVSKRRNKVKKYNGKLHYILNISGDFADIFYQKLGFRLAEGKKQILESYLKQRGLPNPNINLIFNQGERIAKVYNFAQENGLKPLKDLGEGYCKNLYRYISGERTPSLMMLKKLLSKLQTRIPQIEKLPEFAYLKSLAFSGFFFSPVTSIQKKKNVVYDFTVPKYHNFIGNGFVSHNTLLAKAVAGEAEVPFFSISASEFVEMFVGVGAARVRDLFEKAKRNAPSIIFIDELDAIGRLRGSGLGGSHDEREQTLNQILVEMDGFETDTNVIIMAATNRPDVLDPALLRPGRFDRRVVLDLPDLKERKAILEIYTKNKPMAFGVDLEKIARSTAGFSGADLKNLANEAAILAARSNKKKIEMANLEEAIEKVLLGPERKSRVLSKKEKEITAYHEAGHAVVAKFLPNCDPVHKVSIISRGLALGYTWNLPSEDRHLRSKSKFEDDIASLLGGRVAEKLRFQEVTTGAENDLRQATKMARAMVTDYGMSEKLGSATWGEKEELTFLGKEIAEHKTYSEEIAALIDKEVSSIIKKAENRAKEILIKNKKIWYKLAKLLIEKETVEEDEFNKLFPKRLTSSD